MISGAEALQRLQQGNRRFAEGSDDPGPRLHQARRRELVDAQEPWAVVLGCSDSRVPPEFVFDQGLGDLFVVRVAGNVASAAQIGSIEKAIEWFGTRLIVVLGHHGCGAVEATLEDLENPVENVSPHLRFLADRIGPPVADLLQTDLKHDRQALWVEAVRANVRSAVGHLQTESEALKGAVSSDGLLVVGGVYSLESGQVEFLD